MYDAFLPKGYVIISVSALFVRTPSMEEYELLAMSTFIF